MSGSWLSLYPSLVLFEHLVLFLINILLFTDQKKKKFMECQIKKDQPPSNMDNHKPIHK